MRAVLLAWALVGSAAVLFSVAEDRLIHVDIAVDDGDDEEGAVIAGDESAFPPVNFASERDADVKLHDLVAEVERDSAPRRVWAIGKSTERGLFYFEGNNWKRAEIGDAPKNLYPDSIVQSKNGGVLVLWKQRGTRPMLHLGEHKQGEHKILFSVPDTIRDPRATQMADGGIVITGRSANVITFSGDGGTPFVKEMPDDAFYPLVPYENGNVSEDYTPIRVVEDSTGQRWFWSQTMDHENRDKRLKGALILVGEEKLVTEGLPFVGPDNPVIWIEEWKKGRMFFAVAGGGFFDFDLSAEKRNYGASSFESLRYIERVFEAGGNRYLIATPRPTKFDVEMSKALASTLSLKKTLFYNPDEETTSLYLVDGFDIVRLTRKLDDEPDFRWFDRPLVETGEGFWLGARKGKLAFVPFGRDAKIRYLSSENGLPLDNPRCLARATEDAMIVLDPNSGESCFVPTSPPEPSTMTPRPDILKADSMLFEDSRGRVCGMMEKWTKFKIRENGSWKELPSPDLGLPAGDFQLAVDGHGRGWLVPGNEGGAAVFDPGSDDWAVFNTLREALEAEMKPGDRLRMGDYLGHMPVSSDTDPRQICFVSLDGKVRHFDGKKWSEVSLSEIGGEGSKLTASPFFSDKSELVVPIANTRWVRGPGGSWQAREKIKEDIETPLYLRDRAELPGEIDVSAAGVGKITGAFCDRLGVCWISDSGGRLWKAIPGGLVSVFPERVERPLASGDSIRDVAIDRDGTAFLRLEFGYGGGRHLVIPARGAAPAAKVEVLEIEADVVRFGFGEPSRNQWRIDDGEWSVATEEKSITVSGLIPGKHRLEARAWSDELRPSETTASTEFAIETMDEAEFERLLALLGEEALMERENAARRLTSQGTAIVPRLKESRTKADDSTRWWIDAILQGIEAKTE